jgi:hypothetical protein
VDTKEPFNLHSFVGRPGIVSSSEKPNTGVLSTEQICAELDQGVKERKIIPITGPAGSGKKWLLDEWIRHRSRTIKPDQVVFINMSPTPNKSLPPICIAMSRIWDSLEQLARPAYARQQANAHNIKMYNATWLESLRIQVERALDKQDIRAVAIARTHLCDTNAIDWILDLRNCWDRIAGYRSRIALILAFTSNAEGAQPALVKQIKKRDEIRPDVLQLTLPYVTATEFTYVFARLIRRNMNATFDQSLTGQEQAKIAKHWHEITNGNWYLLSESAKYIDEELGQHSGAETRSITADVLDRAEKRFQRAQA